jgi:hypothetical protein
MSIFDQVLSFIRSPAPDAFEPLALEVFRYQARNVPPYRDYLEHLDIDLNDVHMLPQVPPVSTVAFKYAPMESRAEPPSSRSRLFMTSGTTIGKAERGRHLVLRPEVYRASAISHLRRMFFAAERRMAMLALHPTADRMPESSLSQMISWGIEEFGSDLRLCAATPAGIDSETAVAFLRESARANEPVAILGTTASFAALFATLDEDEGPVRLPEGSRMMDTGGAKGQVIPLDAAEVAAKAKHLLAIEPALVINEYGMTEMCSQLYDATSFNSDSELPPGHRLKLAPPWLRAVALDPATLTPVIDGQIGLLSFFDLANVGSVSALVTEDFGIVRDGAIAILGRATAADARGCALAIEQFAASEHTPVT